jgi:Trk-type K+ transport system membrane component
MGYFYAKRCDQIKYKKFSSLLAGHDRLGRVAKRHSQRNFLKIMATITLLLPILHPQILPTMSQSIRQSVSASSMYFGSVASRSAAPRLL